jgi:AraC family transcriptional regulator
MHGNIASPIRLSDLSRTAGMSTFAFARAFRNTMGVPPHKFLTRLRLERGQQLLQSREMSVGQIAHEVGFADQSQFTSHFRSLFGTTPARFRAKNR